MSVSSDRPEFLYKYRSLAGENRKRVEQVFATHELYLASRTTFNDPFDCRPRLTLEGSKQQFRAYAKRVLRSLPSRERKQKVHQIVRSRGERSAADLENVTRDVNEFMDGIGVLCLTAKPNDILMWGHYADGHTGICLQFSTAFPDLDLAKLSPVIYQDAYPTFSVIATPPDQMAKIATYTKARAWAYEEEWRLIEPIHGPGVREFDPQCLTGVIFGARISDANRTLVTQWARDHTPPVKLYAANLGEHEFRIDITPSFG